MKNITFKEFVRLHPDKIRYYHNIFENVKPKNHIKWMKAKPLQKMKFGEVSLIRKWFVNGEMDNVFSLIFESKHPNKYIRWFLNLLIFNVKLDRIRISDFYPVINWVREELEKISKIEKQLENNEFDPYAPDAEGLKIFGELNSIIPLARKYGIRQKDIANDWTYMEVFTELLYDKRHYDYEKEYSENIKRQN